MIGIIYEWPTQTKNCCHCQTWAKCHFGHCGHCAKCAFLHHKVEGGPGHFFAFVVKSLLYMAVCSTFSNQWCPFCSFLDVSWAALISNKLCSLTLHRRYDYGRTLVVHQMSVTQMVLLLNQQIWSIVKMTPLLQDDVFRRVSSLEFFIKTIQ